MIMITSLTFLADDSRKTNHSAATCLREMMCVCILKETL